jgi:hypothetical protein
MGRRVYVEHEGDYINVAEISAWVGGVKQVVVSGGVEPIFALQGWEYLVDDDTTTWAGTNGGGQIWIDMGDDKPIDQIKIINRGDDEADPFWKEVVRNRILGCRVVLRRADGATSWQTTINEVLDEYQFDI